MSLPSDDSQEFHNIDLDAVILSELHPDDSRPSPRSSPSLSFSSEHIENYTTSENTQLSSMIPISSNEYLNYLSKQLMNDYAKYFYLKPTVQIEELNECIENLLTHMEEFYGLIERIRNDSNSCLDQYTLFLLPKLEECQKLFSFIDKLERIVNHVSVQVSLMEREISKAEKMMGIKTSTVKKLFSLITSNKNTLEIQSRYRYIPPNIFKTEELLKM